MKRSNERKINILAVLPVIYADTHLMLTSQLDAEEEMKKDWQHHGVFGGSGDKGKGI